MAKLKVRVSVSEVTTIETEDYRDEWEETDQGLEAGAGSEIPEDFAIQQFKDDLYNGNEDLGTVFESSPLEVIKAE